MTSDQPYILLQFPSSDMEMSEKIKETFGDQATLVHSRQFDASLADIVQYLLPQIPLTAKLLFDYVATKNSADAKKRVLVSKGGEVSIHGYSQQEVESILSKISTNKR